MQNLDAKLVLLDEDHSGRDEMNLAGNPFALLQAAGKSGQTYLRHEWERRLPSGKLVTAVWKVDGDSELGMPGPNEELLYLVLLQITREQRDETGEWPQTVHFSRHDVLKRLKWQDGPREYKTLRDGFFRLQAVSIQSEYSFHDPRTGAPLPAIAFNLIDAFVFVDEKKNRQEHDLPFSWFKWSDIILNSLKQGNVRSLALEFTLSLDTPTSRRLFRLLELRRHAKKPVLESVKLDVFEVRDRLGMTAYGYPSKVKEKLAPAIEELISRGYLSHVDYEKTGKKAESAIFHFGSVKQQSKATTPIPVDAEKPRDSNKSSTFQNGKRSKQTSTGNPVDLEASKTVSESDMGNPISNVRADALRCAAVFQSLEPEEQAELMELAKKDVSPIWHDRVGDAKSPMSLGLWKLVAQRYPGRVEK